METVPLVDSNMTIQQGMEDITDTGRTCTFVNQTEDSYIFSCGEYNPLFAMLTLAFIFLPSLNVLGALYGPKTAGYHGFVWGLVMATVSGIWFVCIMFKEYGSFITIIIEGNDAVEEFLLKGGDQAGIIGFIVIVSLTTMSLGLVMIFSGSKVSHTEKEIIKLSKKEHITSFVFHSLLFPLLFLFPLLHHRQLHD